MRKKIWILGILLSLCLLGTGVYANVYTAGITYTGITDGSAGALTYWLNENADNGVTIEIVSWETENIVRTIAGPTTKGKHVVAFDGNDDLASPLPAGDYGIKITASDDGYSEWTRISPRNDATCMYSGRDIVVNNNPKSPAFGRIYLTNASNGTPTEPGWYTGGSLDEGVYAFNPDQTYLEGLEGALGYCTGNATIGLPKPNTPNESSLKGISIDDEDNVYVADYLDLHEYLWRGDAAFSAGTIDTLFSQLAVASVPSEKGHGNILGVKVIGSGAERILYYSDEDIIASQGHAVMRADLGDKTNLDTAGSAGVEVVPPPAGSWVNLQDITLDSSGNYYCQVYRWAANEKDALWKFAPDGTTLLWSLPKANYYTVNYGVGLDEPRGRVYITQYQDPADTTTSSTLYQIDMATGAELDQYKLPDGNGYQGSNVDAAGNVYVISFLAETWLVVSPPDGENSYTYWINEPQPIPQAVHEIRWMFYE